MDYCNYNFLNNPFPRDRVEDMILNLDLTDVWRDLNAGCKRSTWRRPAPLQQKSPINVFLISESMVPYVEQTDSQYGYRLDHSTTVLEFCKRKKEKEKHSRNLIVPC